MSEEREKHFIEFSAKVSTYSRKKLVRELFNACEAITYLDDRLKKLDEPVPSPEILVEEKQKTLKEKISEFLK